MALCSLRVKSWFLASHYSCKFFCLNLREWDIHFPEMCKGRLFLCSFWVSKHVLHSLYNSLLHSASGWLLFVPLKSAQVPLLYKPSWPSSVAPFPPRVPLEPSAYLYFTICSSLIVWASPQPTCQPLRAGLCLVLSRRIFLIRSFPSPPTLCLGQMPLLWVFPQLYSPWIRIICSGFSIQTALPCISLYLTTCVLMVNTLVGDQLILVCLRLSLV